LRRGVLDIVGGDVGRDAADADRLATGGIEVPRIVEARPLGVADVEFGVGGVGQHFGDIRRRDVRKKFRRERGNRGGGVLQARLQPAAGRGVRRLVADVVIAANLERGKLHELRRARGGSSGGGRGDRGRRRGSLAEAGRRYSQ